MGAGILFFKIGVVVLLRVRTLLSWGQNGHAILGWNRKTMLKMQYGHYVPPIWEKWWFIVLRSIMGYDKTRSISQKQNISSLQPTVEEQIHLCSKWTNSLMLGKYIRAHFFIALTPGSGMRLSVRTDHEWKALLAYSTHATWCKTRTTPMSCMYAVSDH